MDDDVRLAGAERDRNVGGRTVKDYLRMPRAEFMAKMRQMFPDHIEGMDRRLDEHLRAWRKNKRFVPSQSDGDRLYLLWVLDHVPGLDLHQKNTMLARLRAPPSELSDEVLHILDIVIAFRMAERNLAAATNGTGAYTEEDLAELMQSDRDRLRDFVRSLARLKRDQVDLTDETWISAPEPTRSRALARLEAHKKAYRDTVDHPWLDETDPKGRKRTRGEKEAIVMGLMYNGPQPRTAEDERWRREDKKQRMRDAINTIVTQNELIQGVWSDHPLAPILDQGVPNRFGRLEENKRTEMRFPYIKPSFERVDSYAADNMEMIAASVAPQRVVRE